MDDIKRTCIDCTLGSCDEKDKPYPPFCMCNEISSNLKEEALDNYIDENKRMMINAAIVEAEDYGTLTRVEEIAKFSKLMGYKKIGIACCVGLLHEANIFSKVLRAKGFSVVGLSCKAGITKKAEVDIPEFCNEIGENMCNPILQAKKLNEEQTDFNVVIGLCVGHDSLFYKYSNAPVTTLLTKDRVLGHNPAVALYQANSYYSKILKEDK